MGKLTGSECDVIVLGVGTCGEDLSLRLLEAGLEVVGIEAALVGGECPYYACLPSKMIIRAANALQEARRVNELAGRASVTPDWEPVAARVRAEATGNWDDSIAVRRYEERGGRLIHGYGKLSGPHSVSVGGETITARRGIVIATGSAPAVPPIPGLPEIEYWTTRDIIRQERLPESLIVIGGGAVGCELAQALARFGVVVTIVEAAERLLPAEEPEAARALQATFEAEGIQVRSGVKIESIEQNGDQITVRLDDGDDLNGQRLLVATGRKAVLNGLGLENAGVQTTAQGIEVDGCMRAADRIWAMGDVTGKAMFTHVALYQSAIIAAEILGQDHHEARYDAIPRVTFTDPEIGSVGRTEAAARAEGMDTAVVIKDLRATFRGWLHRADDGIIKLVTDRKTGRLIGASVVGPHAGEMLGMLGLAVHAGVPISNLQSMIYAFPTFYGGIGEAVGAYGRGLGTVMDPSYKGFELFDDVATVEGAREP